MPKKESRRKRRKSFSSNTFQALEDRRMLATFVVNNLLDAPVNNPTEVPGSLRQAVFDANETPGADTIVFEGFASSGLITLNAGELQVTESVDIIGPGASELTISGDDSSTIFHFGDDTGASTFGLSGLTLADGNGISGAGIGRVGGAVLFFDSNGSGGEDTLNISDSVIRDSDAAFGGGVHAVLGTLNISDTTLTGNAAENAAFLQGGGGLSLEQTDTTLERVNVTENTAANTGGGINSFARAGTALAGNSNLTIIDSNISNNTASRAGGIASITRSASADASLIISGSTISDNTALTREAGGIRADGAVVTISNSLLSGNRVEVNSDGGAIFTANSELVIENSTLSDNLTLSDSGAIHAVSDANLVSGSNTGQSTTDIVNSTIAFNRDFAGSVTAEARAGTTSLITVSNSIFSNNLDRNFNAFGAGQALIISDGFNISDDFSGNLTGTGDQQGIDPLLLPLADNGGATLTHALRLESPAIDAGSNALAVDSNGNPLATDQRGTGFARVLDGSVDVGAFETELLQGDLIVSTNTDVVDNDFSSGELSLREAVLITNARDGLDQITFDSALNGQTITLTNDALTGELQVTDSVDIIGPGASNLTISGGNATGIFQFGDQQGASTFSVSGLTLADGNRTNNADLARFGGAVQFFDEFGSGGEDTLNISNAVISNNRAVLGGGLHSVLGTLNVTDTSFSGNVATQGSGEFGGGGLSLQQTDATLERVIVTGNTAANFGGGIVNFVDSATANQGDANLTIIDSTISGNTADAGGGILNLTLSVLAEANLDISGSTITGNEATVDSGAGIRSDAGVVTISNSLISENSAVAGGAGAGIFAVNADLRVQNSTLSGNNSGTNTGGAIRIQATRNADPDGLGISQTTIVNSTIAFNSQSAGAVTNEARANSTSLVTFQNSIFTNNAVSNFGVVSSGGNANFVSAGHNLSDDATGNLFAAGDQINTNPLLFPLADNGGLTQTHALQVGSPAIDAGSNALAVDADGNALTTDQRGEGFARILDGTPPTVDIGAFESKTFDGDLVVSENSDVVDSFTGPEQLSLREATLIANDRPGFDTITFAAGLSGETISLNPQSELQLTESVDIIGPGSSQLTIIADQSRIFQIGDINAASTFSLSGLTLADGNTAENGGAILFSDANGAGGEDTLNISNAIFRDNRADVGGGIHAVLGTLNISDTTLTGNEATNVTLLQGGGGLSLEQTDTTLERVTITNNSAGNTGGGINSFARAGSALAGDSNLTIIDSNISNNTAGRAGGIASITRTASADTSLTISGSTISDNTALSVEAGGIRADGAVVTILNSLLSGNTANNGRDGGAIFTANSELVIENSTLSGNSTLSDSGAIHAVSDANLVSGSNTGQSTTDIVSSTIAFNSDAAGTVTAEARAATSSTIRFSNSIFSDNADSNLNAFGAGQAAIISEGFNISDDATGNLNATGDQPNTDPLLEALADNGGPTQTHGLQTGSPAIDVGNSTLPTDQRGLTRPFDDPTVANATGGNGSDIGAFEVVLPETPSLLVTTALDVVDEFDQQTSLREAIAFADSLSGEDIISFNSSLAGETITLGGSELQINDSLVIDASTLPSPLIIDASGQSRVLSFLDATGNLTIDSLTITGGETAGFGAGINFRSQETLTINNSNVVDNSSDTEGGGVATSNGSIVITNSTVTGNQGGGNGGGIRGNGSSVTVVDSVISGNTAGEDGGGIRITGGSVNVTGSEISGNIAGIDGGGIHTNSGNVTVTDSAILDNTALSSSGDGGGIRTDAGNVAVINSTIRGNTAADDGGGIRTSTGDTSVINSTIADNSSADSGGGLISGNGHVIVTNSTISDNTAGDDGGGIAVASGSLSVTNSTISGNTAGVDGGGISTNTNLTEDTTLIVNSTISGNTAGGSGGGIDNFDGLTRIISSTVTGNQAAIGGGVASFGDSFTRTEVGSSVIAGNSSTTGGADVSSQDAGDPDNSFVSLGFNLIGDGQFAGTDFFTDAVNGDQVGTTANPLDAVLDELADNGGPTLTHALLPGSPAVDAGNNALAVDADGNPLDFDQRGEGFDRIFGGTVDMGAFESDVADVVAPSVESIVVNNGDEQRSMVNVSTVSFSEIVNVSAADFVLQNSDTGTNVTPTVSTQVVDGKTVATLTFSGTGTTAGSLDDGNYSLTVLDTITDTAGNVLDGDGDGTAGGNATDDFFRLFGDVNGDRTVNVIDFFQFRNAFGGSGNFNAAFDSNGDGVINILDFFQFSSRFRTSV